MLRFTLLVLIHIFLTIVLAAFLFVVLPHNGDYWGVALAQLWSLLVITLGDRAILSSLKAKRLGETNALVQRISNLRALRRSPRRFEVFSSRELSDNILIIDSYFRAPALVVGSEVMAKMRSEDLNQLLALAITRLEQGKWRYASVSAQLLAIFAAPMLLVSMLRIPKAFASLLSSPCDVMTLIAWRAGMVGELNAPAIDFAQAAYPQLWGEAHPRVNQILSSFMMRLLKHFLLVPAERSSFIAKLQQGEAVESV